jgi:hypothetical protein
MSKQYEEFAKKNKNIIGTKTSREDKNSNENGTLCIAIPMKNSTKTRADKIVLDEKFIKVIEHEYAVRYLEHMGLQATQQSI